MKGWALYKLRSYNPFRHALSFQKYWDTHFYQSLQTLKLCMASESATWRCVKHSTGIDGQVWVCHLLFLDTVIKSPELLLVLLSLVSVSQLKYFGTLLQTKTFWTFNTLTLKRLTQFFFKHECDQCKKPVPLRQGEERLKYDDHKVQIFSWKTILSLPHLLHGAFTWH